MGVTEEGPVEPSGSPRPGFPDDEKGLRESDSALAPRQLALHVPPTDSLLARAPSSFCGGFGLELS